MSKYFGSFFWTKRNHTAAGTFAGEERVVDVLALNKNITFFSSDAYSNPG